MMSDTNSKLTITAEKPSPESPRSSVIEKEADTNRNMAVKSDDKSAAIVENTYEQLLGLEADSIIGTIQKEGKVLFMVSWKNSVDTEAYTLLDAEFVNDKYPQLINEFYMKTFQNNPLYSSGSVIDKNDNDKNDIEIELATITVKTTYDDDESSSDNSDDEIDLNNIVCPNGYNSSRYHCGRFNNNHCNNIRHNYSGFNGGHYSYTVFSNSRTMNDVYYRSDDDEDNDGFLGTDFLRDVSDIHEE